MGRLGLGTGRHRRGPIGAAAVPPPALPSGFAMNGATNGALKAMLARVAAGTGRGRIVIKGDSTSAGAGGGDAASPQQLGNARVNRTSAVLAARLTAAGYPTLDGAVVGDNGAKDYVPLSSYDPRVAFGAASPWSMSGGQDVAGGHYFYTPGGGGTIDFAPVDAVDRFEVVLFNVGGSFDFRIDGALPASIVGAGASVAGGVVAPPNTAAGLTRVVIAAGSSGTHSLRVTSGAEGVVRSLRAWSSGVAAIDIINHASNGATSGDQATVGHGWSNNDSLGFDVPDLAIVNLGLNDMGTQVSVAAYRANLQTIVDTARLSGDVLLVFPHPAGEQFAVNAAAYRDAAAAVATANNVAFLSLFDYFGGAFTPALQARMADGLVHGDAAFYAEIGDLYRRCIAVMAS